MVSRPRARRWTLADLDRSSTYELRWDAAGQRWECFPRGASEPLVTREPLRRPRGGSDGGTGGEGVARARADAGLVDVDTAPPRALGPDHI